MEPNFGPKRRPKDYAPWPSCPGLLNATRIVVTAPLSDPKSMLMHTGSPCMPERHGPSALHLPKYVSISNRRGGGEAVVARTLADRDWEQVVAGACDLRAVGDGGLHLVGGTGAGRAGLAG